MAEYVRDAAMTAAVLGFFASAWFGWAQESPPQPWRKWLIGGSVLSLITAAIGGTVAWQNWDSGTALDRDAARTFGIVVGLELLLSVVGALVLTRRHRGDLIAPWVALIVGLHLFPLAPLFDYPLLYVPATLVTMAAIASMPLARKGGMVTSAVTGALCGMALVGSALFSVVAAISS
jgi:hypothetical protein